MATPAASSHDAILRYLRSGLKSAVHEPMHAGAGARASARSTWDRQLSAGEVWQGEGSGEAADAEARGGMRWFNGIMWMAYLAGRDLSTRIWSSVDGMREFFGAISGHAGPVITTNLAPYVWI